MTSILGRGVERGRLSKKLGNDSIVKLLLFEIYY